MLRSLIEGLPWQETPQSSNVARVAWVAQVTGQHGGDESDCPGYLYVEFKAGEQHSLYRYDDVERARWEALMRAESVGSMLAKLVKGKFDYRLIEPTEDVSSGRDESLQMLIEIRDELRSLRKLFQGALRPRPRPTAQGGDDGQDD